MSNKLLATSSSCPAPNSAFGLTLTPSTTPNLRDSACSLALPFPPLGPNSPSHSHSNPAVMQGLSFLNTQCVLVFFCIVSYF